MIPLGTTKPAKPKNLLFAAGSNEKHGVNAAVQLRVVGHLRVLAPDHLPWRGHQPQLAHVDLEHSALGDHAETREEARLRVLLHRDDAQLERGAQLGVRHVGLAEAQAAGADEALVLGRQARERVAHERGLCYHALPGFAFWGFLRLVLDAIIWYSAAKFSKISSSETLMC